MISYDHKQALAALTEDTQLRADAIHAIAKLLQRDAGVAVSAEEEYWEMATEYYDAAARVLTKGLPVEDEPVQGDAVPKAVLVGL